MALVPAASGAGRVTMGGDASRLGWFDGLRGAVFAGWTYAPATPGTTLQVRLASGIGAVTVAADRYRGDVQRLGRPGYVGFVACASALGGGDEPVACTWADDGAALPGSPWRPRSPPEAFATTHLRGEVDAEEPALLQVSGRVVDLRSPDRRVRIRLVAGQMIVAQGLACRFRPAGSDIGDDFHGFSLPRPAAELPLNLEDADSGERFAIVQAG